MTPVLYWMRSQRDRVDLYETYSRERFAAFERAAWNAGLGFDVVTADELVLGVTESGRGQVLLRGEELDPGLSLFHTKVMTWPAYMPDVWRHLTLFALLEAMGFSTTVPARLSVIGNDKLLSLAALNPAGQAVIPTVRFATRQFGATKGLFDPASLRYPVIVKPSNWGGGFGIVQARTANELDSVLQLAGAAELMVVVQPFLSGKVTDYRVYCVDGEPVAALSRTAVPGALVGNQAQGGETKRIDVPQELMAPARAIAGVLGLPYAGVDFLHDGDAYFLSEVEIDGGTPAQGFTDIVEARFLAYRRHLDRHRDRLAREGLRP